MKKVFSLALVLVLSCVSLVAQTTLVPNGNKVVINLSPDHTLSLITGYRLRLVSQGAATATVKSFDIGKPSSISATDLRAYVCDSTATTCAASLTTVKLTEGYCQGIPPVKYGFVVDILLSSGGSVTGPLSNKGVDCGTVAVASVSDVLRVQ